MSEEQKKAEFGEVIHSASSVAQKQGIGLTCCCCSSSTCSAAAVSGEAEKTE